MLPNTVPRYKARLSTYYNLFRYNDRFAYCCIGFITVSFFAIEFHEVFQYETIYNGYHNTVERAILPNCSYDSLPFSRGGANWYLVCVSYLAFDNARMIPFLIGTGMIPVTFLFVRKYSNNLAALMASGGLALTPAFLIFDSSSAYTQTWAICFIGSLYYIKKNGYVVASLYILSLCAKAIPVFWLPTILALLYKSEIPKKQKIISSGTMCFIVALSSVLAIGDGGSIVYGGTPLRTAITLDTISESFQWLWSSFRWDYHLLFAVPVFGLITIWKKIPRTALILSMMSVLTLLAITTFTVEGSFPYRMIPNMIMILFMCSLVFVNYLDRIFKRH